MSSATSILRNKLEQPGIIFMAGCYSALTARITEAEGFDAIWCGGSSMGAMHLALPDHGLITPKEMATLIAPIADSVSIPVIADADLGGETSVNVVRTVHLYEQAGIAAIVLEDSVNPKHLYGAREQLQSIEEMCARVAAALKARKDPGFVVIARTDAVYNGGSVDEAIARGKAYADAGADAFFPNGLALSEIDRVAAAVPIPQQGSHHRHSDARSTKLKILNSGSGFMVQEAAFLHRQMIRHLKKDGDWGDVADWYDNTPAMQPAGPRPDVLQAGFHSHFSRAEFRGLTDDAAYLDTAAKWPRRQGA